MATRERFWTRLLLAQVLMVYLDHVHPEETAVTRNCSCYTFNGSEAFSWIDGRKECKRTGGDLVSMETKEEWKFIRDQIQTRWTVKNEWHIGLMKTNRMWIWVSGTRLSWAECNSTGCFPWQKDQPTGGSEKVGLMAKSYPANTRGLFNDVKTDSPKRGFICEHVTDTCKGGVQRCFKTTIQRTTVGKPVPPTTTPLPTTTRKSRSRGAVTNRLSTEESRELDTKRTIATSQSQTTTPLPTTTRKSRSRGTTVTNKPSTEKSWEPNSIRAIVPSQSNGNRHPERKGSGESPNTIIIAVTSAAAALLIILSVVVALLWRRKAYKRHRGSIRLKKKSNARKAAQPRGQLTFVFDGDRVYATVDWSKKKKRKLQRQGEFVYTDLRISDVRDEVVRPAHYVPIYTDIRSTRGPGTSNQEGAINTLEADSPTNKSPV